MTKTIVRVKNTLIGMESGRNLKEQRRKNNGKDRYPLQRLKALPPKKT